MSLTRRNLLKLLSGSLLFQTACTINPKITHHITKKPTMPTVNPFAQVIDNQRLIHIFAPSGYMKNPAMIGTAVQHFQSAGFIVRNQDIAYRHFQRFAGTDTQRSADLQNIAQGHISTPKILMPLRGGYGAVRILPSIDWSSLGARMREMGTILCGFSDVCAIQLALLARTGMPSFAGPMINSFFARETPDYYTMQNFINGITQPNLIIDVTAPIPQTMNIQGTFWGGNLSVLESLVGSPYMPNIEGGILFLEDVSEQVYRIERMLETLLLSGILQKQQAVVLGSFRTTPDSDIYDSSYNFDTVIRYISNVSGIPFFTNFPFGHIKHKMTFPLGVPCQLVTNSQGYSIKFSNYPTLNSQLFNFSALLDVTDGPSPAEATLQIS